MIEFTVKPLDWEKRSDGSYHVETVFGYLWVRPKHCYPDHYIWVWGWLFEEYYDEGECDCLSLDDGKVKAFEFYKTHFPPIMEQVNVTV